MNQGIPTTALHPAHGGEPLFVTTRWSVVTAAGDGLSPGAEEALAQLCRSYWYPLYVYVRRKGHSSEEAQDLTQAFFERLLEKNYVAQADRARGRFRTFLLAALQHFLADEWDKSRRLKRGGGQVIVSFDALTAEERYQLEPADQPDAARLFERRWVTTLLDRVLTRLETEFRVAEKGRLFEHLRPSLLHDDAATSHAELGARLNLSEAAVRQALHRLRRRYRDLFRDEIAQTVTRPEDVDDEVRHLFTVLADP